MLSQKAGVCYTTISAYENDAQAPRFDKAIEILNALGLKCQIIEK